MPLPSFPSRSFTQFQAELVSATTKATMPSGALTGSERIPILETELTPPDISETNSKITLDATRHVPTRDFTSPQEWAYVPNPSVDALSSKLNYIYNQAGFWADNFNERNPGHAACHRFGSGNHQRSENALGRCLIRFTSKENRYTFMCIVGLNCSTCQHTLQLLHRNFWVKFGRSVLVVAYHYIR